MARLLLALPLAFILASGAVHAENANQHASAARNAERKHEWKKMLAEYEAAYKLQPNSEYLVGMGDAYAKMGDKANARKQYNAAMADPLALDNEPIKAKLAALDSGSSDALGLDLAPPPAATANNDLGLGDLPAPAPAPKKGKKGAAPAGGGDLSLDLTTPSGGGLDLPAAPPKKVATNDARPAAADPFALDIAPAPAKPAAPAAKPAAADPFALDIAPAPAPARPSTPPPAIAATTPPPAKPTPAPIATPGTTSTKVAVTTPPPTHTTAPAQPPPPAPAHLSSPVPSTAVATTEPRVIERNNHVIAYCTAGLAVGALAVGGLYYSKASQNQTDLTSQVRPGAQQQALIEEQKTNKSLAFAGLLAGVVLAGVTTAIFVF